MNKLISITMIIIGFVLIGLGLDYESWAVGSAGIGCVLSSLVFL